MNTESQPGLMVSELPSQRGNDLSHEQTSLLAAIVQSSQEAIIAKTLDGIITAWNPAAERIYGYTAQEAIGQPVTILIPPEKNEEFASLMSRLERGIMIEPFETVRIRKDSRRIDILLTISPLRNSSGELVGASVIASDITNAKEQERSRKSAEERLNLAMEIAHIGVWEWRMDTDHVFWSPNIESIHSMPSGVPVSNFSEVVAHVLPEDRNAFLSVISQAAETGRDFRLEYRLLKSPGTWVAALGKLVDFGTSKRMIGICMDITEQKRLENALLDEAALRESEARLHELADVMPHMVWTMRTDGIITYANQRCIDYTGINPGATGFETTQRFVHPEDVPKARRKFRSALKRGTPHQYEIRIRSSGDLYSWHTIRLIPIRDKNGRTVRWLGSATDVNVQRRAAESFQHATTILKHDVHERTRELSESIASFENMLYNIGHHLRAPLRAMNGFAGILMEDQGVHMSPAAQEAAQRIVCASTRMDRLIADLLAYGRATHDEFPCERVDMDLEVRHALQRFNKQLRARNAQVHVRGFLPRVWSNAGAVGLVLDQLLDNALKFVPPDRSPQIEVTVEHKEGVARVKLKDNGVGIAPEYQARIFHLFETLHGYEGHNGTGVGLALCHKVMQRVNGNIGVKSKPGEGSTFWVEFPLDPTERLPFAINPSDFKSLPPSDGIVITGSDGRVRWVNPGFEKICGYTIDEIIGCKPGELLQGAGSDPVEVQKLRKALRSKTPCTATLVNYRKNREPYWVCMTLHPIRRSDAIEGYASVQREVQIPMDPSIARQLRFGLRNVVRVLRRAPIIAEDLPTMNPHRADPLMQCVDP